MNENSQPSVTEGLTVNQVEQPAERRTKIILWVVAVVLVAGGAARYFVGNLGSEQPVSVESFQQGVQSVPPNNPSQSTFSAPQQ